MLRRSGSIQEGADSRRIDELERTGIASGRAPVDEDGRGVASSQPRQGSDTVRREELDVEAEGDVRRSPRRDPDDHHVP